ncbi:carbohydrate kinase [Lacihabitans sp. LS3-19]|uniref:carbohydrate kinase family protein n=1 Tax=Lacihabitans sp. LS3-19 TaxID=2487335 RepID=UPI0020CBD3E7|nr:PfkB family carbohydrate kinase [Lacihabitans sp. LS3-19]MCP9767762.1 carbohydrate kinase [Lacihabitans sp. LS3-19]
MDKKEFALLAVGELLGDFIGSEVTENIFNTSKFERFQGGSPANLASNMARLGYNTAIVSAVGNDGLGKYLIQKVNEAGVDTTNVIVHPTEPTSIVLVSRTTGTPDFIPYRTADKMIEKFNITDQLLQKASIFHTTCWPLSKQPAQSAVLDAAKRAKALGCILSADLNYAEKVWPERHVAHAIIKEYLSFGALIKLSEDDAKRFYGEEIERERIFANFHEWGAELICYTMGEKGSIVSYENGTKQIYDKPQAVNVIDATGAGDSFWAGFLAAYLEKQPIEVCAKAGANMAKIKLTTVGPIKQDVDIDRLFS